MGGDFNNGEYEGVIKIGEGSSCEVYVGMRKEDGKEVVLKVVGLGSRERRKRFIKEVQTLHQLNPHPLIVQLEDCYYSLNSRLGVEVLEKCEIDLLQYLLSFPSHLIPLSTTRHLFQLLSLSIHHCHSNGIVHNDIKPDNVLLTLSPSTGDVISLKLADFGFSLHFTPLPTSPSDRSTNPPPPSPSDLSSPSSPPSSPLSPPLSPHLSHPSVHIPKYKFETEEEGGTSQYFPPELFSQFDSDVDNKREYRADKGDIWAMGVTLFAMATGSFPYTFLDGERVYNDLRLVYQCTGDTLCYDLISHLLNPDPALRYDIHQVLLHPWLSSLPPLSI